MTTDVLNTADEFDVSDAGVQTLKGAVATIIDFEVVEKGNGVSHELTFDVEGLGFLVTKGYWFEHENPKAVQAGRGQLKRIAKAAIGRTSYSASSLIGARLLVDVAENDNGFAEIKRPTAITE